MELFEKVKAGDTGAIDVTSSVGVKIGLRPVHTMKGNFVWDQKDGIQFKEDPDGKYELILRQ